MQNNNESIKSIIIPYKSQLEQQERQEKSYKFDEELDEGQRVLARLHHDCNQKYDENLEKEFRDNKNKNRTFYQKEENNLLEMLEKTQNRKNGLAEMEQEKDQSISFSKNLNKKTSKMFLGCNCLKSKCSKNYCECFTQGRRCNELCKCMGCENHSQNQFRLRLNIDIEVGERICYCKKSNCLKKYCECFNNSTRCSGNCKCEECKNTQGSIQNEQIQLGKIQTQKQRSEEEIEEINSKIDEIARITPQEYRELMFSFMEYWLA